jgi:hypothetical protein
MPIKDDKVTVQTILEKEKHEILKSVAKKKGLSVSSYIRVLILENLEDKPESAKTA